MTDLTPERLFPILHPDEYGRSQLQCPRSIPWALIEPQDAQAHSNHGQSLERLAERGGLSPSEAVAVIEGRKWRAMENVEAVAELRRHVTAYEETGITALRADVERLTRERDDARESVDRANALIGQQADEFDRDQYLAEQQFQSLAHEHAQAVAERDEARAEVERIRADNEQLRELVRDARGHLMEPNVMMRTAWRERARAALETKP